MNHKKVYNEFQIYLIVFYVMCLMLVPILSIISFLFDFHLYTTTNVIVLFSTIVLLIFFVLGLIFLLIRRDYYERRLKPSYQREFTFVMSVCALGVLGLGILFMYFGGSDYYVPHFIVPIAIIVFSILYIVGDRYFNVSLLKKR